MMAHDLLTEPLLSWRDARRQRDRTTLPGILARLASGEVADFPRLRAHQLHPWCMFLTQLAAIALKRAGASDPVVSEDEWRAHLLALTGGAHEPWCLVVDDLAQPAFFQPPVPERTVATWSVCEHPDDIDVLVTSKGHDLKCGVISPDDIEAWINALVALQTMQGRPGRGYNRISRMKGAYGSRARVGLARDNTPAVRFARDVVVLLSTWSGLMERGYGSDGVALVWLAAWDGETSLAMPELAPHFIEVCGRVRFQQVEGRLACRYTTTNTRRCLPEIKNGDVGDPWIPVEREEGALTIGRGGFHYALLSRLLFDGDFAAAAAQETRLDDGDPILMILSAMARGQGKTEGLHERVLPLSARVRRMLGEPDGRSLLGRRAARAVQDAARMRNKVLFPALKKIALGVKTIDDTFNSRVDSVFFDALFGSIEADDDSARITWSRTLRDIAWRELQVAIAQCAVPDVRRYRAISEAERMFLGCVKRNFPDLEKEHVNEDRTIRA
jgi:CRISPR system Cascade subunit CasA